MCVNQATVSEVKGILKIYVKTASAFNVSLLSINICTDLIN